MLLYNYKLDMDFTIEEDAFLVIRDYRKMVARRNRQIRKRKPKYYPPTKITTRSMEKKAQNASVVNDFEFESAPDDLGELIFIAPSSSFFEKSEFSADQPREDMFSPEVNPIRIAQGEEFEENSIVFQCQNEGQNCLYQQNEIQVL